MAQRHMYQSTHFVLSNLRIYFKPFALPSILTLWVLNTYYKPNRSSVKTDTLHVKLSSKKMTTTQPTQLWALKGHTYALFFMA